MKRTILTIAAVVALCSGLVGGARADHGWGCTRLSTGAFAGGTPDYRLLANTYFDYTDLLKARDSGLSDDSIASIAIIAEETGVSYGDIMSDVLDGQTFSQLASDWGLSIGDVYNTGPEKIKIANYVAAYETTGRFAPMMQPGADMPMAVTPAPPMAPMAPVVPTPSQ